MIATRRLPPRRARERGVVLFIALIFVVVMMLAGAGLMRSVDTGAVIAGNFAFKQATIQAVDAGIEAAYNDTFTRVSAASTGTLAANAYYPTLQPLGTDGVPTGVNWASAPVIDLSSTNGNRVQYVIERMCSPMTGGAIPTAEPDVIANCITEPSAAPPCVRAPCPPWTAGQKTNYRVTVRVTGPRSTVTMAQAVVAF
jgi:Tfp pilus assembly protein PilX